MAAGARRGAEPRGAAGRAARPPHSRSRPGARRSAWRRRAGRTARPPHSRSRPGRPEISCGGAAPVVRRALPTADHAPAARRSAVAAPSRSYGAPSPQPTLRTTAHPVRGPLLAVPAVRGSAVALPRRPYGHPSPQPITPRQSGDQLWRRRAGGERADRHSRSRPGSPEISCGGAEPEASGQTATTDLAGTRSAWHPKRPAPEAPATPRPATPARAGQPAPAGATARTGVRSSAGPAAATPSASTASSASATGRDSAALSTPTSSGPTTKPV